MTSIRPKTDSASGGDGAPKAYTAAQDKPTSAQLSSEKLRAWFLGKLTVIQGVQLGLSTILMAGLLVHATPWGKNYLSAGILAFAALAVLASIALALVGQMLATGHRTELERIEVYLQDFCDLQQAKKALADMSPFPAGSNISPAGKGWNNLLKIIDQMRNERRIEEAHESIGQQVSSYDMQRLRAVFDSLPDGIVVADAGGAIVLTNCVCEGELGRSLKEMAGKSILELFDDAKAKETLQEMLDPNTLHSEVSLEVTLSRANAIQKNDAEAHPQSPNDGTPVTTLSVRCYRLSNTRKKSDILLAMRDITQQKIAETAQEAFIAHVGHEFRSPLTNIRAYAETLLSDMILDAATQKEAFNVINEETARLILMVNDVLDLSRMETGSLTLNRDNVVTDRLIQHCVNDVQAMATSKQITLQTNYHPKMPTIYADREKIAVVTNNILSNAIKYTPENGTVFVETNVDDNFIYLKVTDTGLGIAVEDIERIFDKFYRVDRKETAEIPGTGLGLAIAREIVTLHGGVINVTSEMNKGTEMLIKLPLTVKSPTIGLSAKS